MSYDQKSIKLDLGNKPVPQLYNPGIDDFEVLQGRGGASAIVAGRFWQVGAGATTTSIPMLTSSGLAVALSTTNQSRLIGSTLEIVIGTTMCEANVTAVSTSGTLTLDSPLPQAPAQGTSFLLIPPNPTQLTGSSIPDTQPIPTKNVNKYVTLANALAITDTAAHVLDLIGTGGLTEEEIRRYRHFKFSVYSTLNQAMNVVLYVANHAKGVTYFNGNYNAIYNGTGVLPASLGMLQIQGPAGGAGSVSYNVSVPCLDGSIFSNLAINVYNGTTAPTSGSVTVVAEMGE